MTFSADEKSLHDGQPRELFDFVLSGGDQPAYYYTTHDEDLSVLAQTYTSIPIRRLPFVSADVENRLELEVEMQADLPLVEELLAKIPPRETVLTVRRYHGNIANVSVIWTGHVANTVVRGQFATMRVPSLLGQSLESDVPGVVMQSLCNHILYDTRCGATRVPKTTTVASIDATNPRLVTVTSLDGAADDVYPAGEIERTSDGERRLILDQNGVVLTLDRAFRTLVATNAVDVSPGCDHLVGTCNTKFDNLVAFGGMPYVPSVKLFRFGTTGDGS